MPDVNATIEKQLLETSRKLSPASLVELVAYAEALAGDRTDKIKFINSMRALSEEAERNGLTEEILKDILEN